jgi:hypothetical protein
MAAAAWLNAPADVEAYRRLTAAAAERMGTPGSTGCSRRPRVEGAIECGALALMFTNGAMSRV